MVKYINSKSGCPVEGIQIEDNNIKKNIPPLHIEMHANSAFIYIFTKPILKLAKIRLLNTQVESVREEGVANLGIKGSNKRLEKNAGGGVPKFVLFVTYY